ncbi:Tn3 family transposase [Kitasatospora sp. NPDC057223]|uniref:Tn3 family transposase n=1 Tax=Kitasatospora sp. NPDC057223 TaxID=3346055 RepID=UPI003639E64C
MSGRARRPPPPGTAVAEYGRIDKTVHLLVRAICHGVRGKLRQAHRAGQEDQLAGPAWALNAVPLWNTRYV